MVMEQTANFVTPTVPHAMAHQPNACHAELMPFSSKQLHSACAEIQHLQEITAFLIVVLQILIEFNNPVYDATILVKHVKVKVHLIASHVNLTS
jgi:hypothetical protein